MPRAIELNCLAVALAALPWIGVGLSEWWFGRSVGFGLQLSVLASWCSVGAALLREAGRHRLRSLPRGGWLLAALLWTGATTMLTWRLDTLGLAGEQAWWKSLKQVGVLLVFAGCLLAPLVVAPRGDEWRKLERGLAIGLLVACVYALVQAVHFHLPLPAVAAIDRWASSNPSIASGSHELYLGHRFVGIPRLRAGACEPLYFGSYLLAALPCVAVASSRRLGRSRWWRQAACGLGAISLVLTFSRGVYAGVVAALLCHLVAWRRAGRAWPKPAAPRLAALAAWGLFAVVLTAALAGLPPWRLPGLLFERGLQTLAGHDMSNWTRFYAWQAAWSAFCEQPLWGVGWGGFGFHYYRLAPEAGAAAHFGWPMANNLPLLLLAETGVVGWALWFWALRPTWALAWRAEDARSFLFSVLCIACFVQFLTHSQLQLPHVWLLLGFSLHAAQQRDAVV
jgi:O-antigen ligase